MHCVLKHRLCLPCRSANLTVLESHHKVFARWWPTPRQVIKQEAVRPMESYIFRSTFTPLTYPLVASKP